MRILVVSTPTPAKWGNGSQLHVWNVATELQKEHEVHVVCIGREVSLRTTSVTLVSPAPPPRPLSRAWGNIRALLWGEPSAIRWLRKSGLGLAVAKAVEERHPDVVYVTNGQAAFVRPFVGTIPTVLSTIDSWSLNELELAKSLRGVRHLWKLAMTRPVIRHDRKALGSFDRLITVAERDKEWILQLNPTVSVEVVSNGVDCTYYYETDRTDIAAETVVFHGCMSYPPNIEAAEQLVQEIMPIVWAKRPTARVVLVGRAPSKRVWALGGDRVMVAGEVDDLRPLVARAAVCAFPMLSGSGIKNKVLEAAALGMPIVASPSAIGSISLIEGQSALIRNDIEDFAEALLTVFDAPDLATRLGRNARRLMEDHYRWASTAEEVARVCSDAARSGTERCGVDTIDPRQ